MLNSPFYSIMDKKPRDETLRQDTPPPTGIFDVIEPLLNSFFLTETQATTFLCSSKSLMTCVTKDSFVGRPCTRSTVMAMVLIRGLESFHVLPNKRWTEERIEYFARDVKRGSLTRPMMVDFIKAFSHQIDQSTTHVSTQIIPAVEDFGEKEEDVEYGDEVVEITEKVDCGKTIAALEEMKRRLLKGHAVVFILKIPDFSGVYVPVKLYACEDEGNVEQKGQYKADYWSWEMARYRHVQKAVEKYLKGLCSTSFDGLQWTEFCRKTAPLGATHRPNEMLGEVYFFRLLLEGTQNESQPCLKTKHDAKLIRLRSLKLLLEYFIKETEQNTDKRRELETMLRFVDGCTTECSNRRPMTTYTDTILRCTLCRKLTNFECDKLWCYCICTCRKRWHLECFVEKLSADRGTKNVLCPAEGCGRETVKCLVVGQHAKLEICSIPVCTQESLIVSLNQILRLSNTLPRGHQSGQKMKSFLKRVLETTSLNPPVQLQLQGEDGCNAQPLGGDEAVDTQRQHAKPKGVGTEVIHGDNASRKRKRPEQELLIDSLTKTSHELMKSPERAAEAGFETQLQQAEIKARKDKKDLEDATQLATQLNQPWKDKNDLEDATKKLVEDAQRKEQDQKRVTKSLDDAQRKATELATQLDQAGKAKKDLEKALDDAERKATQLETELDQAKKDASKLETQLHQDEIDKKRLEELIPRRPLVISVDFVTKTKHELIQIAKQAAADGIPVPLPILDAANILSRSDLKNIVRSYHKLGLYPGLKIRSRDVKEHTASFIAILHPPLPPAPAPGALPPHPKTGQCAWSFDEGSRILTANFASNPARQKVLPFMEGMRVIEPRDEEFLLKMMERTDITLIVEGLLSRPVEEIARQLLDGLTTLGSENVKVGHYQATSSDGMETWTKISTMEIAAKEFSAYVQEVSRHPNEGKITLQGTDFDMKTDKFYLIDFDISSHHPQFLEEFSRNLFLFPEMLPGGKHCMTHAVPKPSRSIMLPLMYLGPPSVSTSLHEDGYGTVDSGHLCLQGWNEVCILPRLEAPGQKAAALEILRATGCTEEEPNAENAQTIPWPKKEMIDTLMRVHRYVYVCQH
jgi:hypothetical protein